MKYIVAALVLAISAAIAPVNLAHAGAPEAELTWTLEFGVGEPSPSLGLSAGWGGRDRPAERLTVADLQIGPQATRARLAGVPVRFSDYRLGQADDPEPIEDSEPWYQRSWVLWGAGGVALAAVAAAAGGSDSGSCTGTCNQTCSGNGGTGICGGQTTVLGQEVPQGPCAGDVCVVCGGTVIGGCSYLPASPSRPERYAPPATPEPGPTGGMGDLAPMTP